MMDSRDDELVSKSLLDDPKSNENYGGEPKTVNVHNCTAKVNGKGDIKLSKKDSKDDVTIGDEDHIVIQYLENRSKDEENKINNASQNHSEYSDGQIEKKELYSDSVDRDEKKKTLKGSEIEDDFNLTGQFIVDDLQKDDLDHLENGDDSQVLEKTLTLAVCSPSVLASTSRNNVSERSTPNIARSDEEHGDNRDPSETKINENTSPGESDLVTESEKSHAKKVTEPNNDTKCESLKRSKQMSIPTNNFEQKGESYFLNRLRAQPRTNIKYGKNRYKIQNTIDETTDVLDSVVHANQISDDRRNSINPETSWKHQNKSRAGRKYPIKADLHVDFSQTRNPLLNRSGSPLLKDQDISRLNGNFSNDVTTKVNKCEQANSFISNIPISHEGDRRQSKLAFYCSTPGGIQNNETKEESKSFFQRRYTKMELRRALPRKSFFNCHEKAMKDAGLEIEDDVSKRKAERLKAKLERIAKEFDPLPSKAVVQTGKENNGIDSSGEHGEVSVLVTDSQSNDPNSNMDEDLYSNDFNENNGLNAEDMNDGMMHLNSSTHTTSKKKRLHPEKTDHVECKPLVHYLEYVKDNQTEYENYCQTSSGLAKNKPIRRLINMGKAFELRHRGGLFKDKEDDVIVMAAKALRPRSSDASRYYKHDNDKSSAHRGQDPSLRQGRPSSDDKRRQEKNAPSSNMTKDDEHHAKSELEKKKIKAEEWAMSVSTNTLTKAKIQSLRQLGGDDEELTKWWVALRRCHYLRTKCLVAESF